MRTRVVASALSIVVMSILLAGCSQDSSHHYQTLSGTVVDGTGQAVANATVHLIPSSVIDRSTITNGSVLSGEAEQYDEPLEDAADSGDPAIVVETTGASGSFFFGAVPTGEFFVFVRPAPSDTEHLPGGDTCRVAQSAAALGSNLRITLSGTPSANATFVGTSVCLGCHDTGYSNHKFTGHANGIRVPGVNSMLQDISKYPDFDDGLASFTSALAYTDPGVTVLFYEDYQSTRGFDKFKVFENVTGGGTVYLKVYLWRDSNTSQYKITLENIINSMDPVSPVTLDVALTYGGAVFKQRYLVKVPTRKGHYTFLQYQQAGSNAYYDRTRQQFRDYHADYFWDDMTKRLTLPPPTKTFEGGCAGCHMPGYRPFMDTTTGEWLADAVDDAGSNYDIDGDSRFDELNVGCEKCHGPGSEHISAQAATRIVALSKTPPGRTNLVCGFCHDRIAGNGTGLINDTPLNAANEFPRAGIRRKDYLANYTTRAAPKASSMWSEFDALHSKSHHQQYSDTLKSAHYRNGKRLVVCADCHTTHDKLHPAMLKHKVGPESQLCQQCHDVDVTAHMTEKIGTSMTGSVTSCVSCHMTKTAKTGAGRYGHLLGVPTGNQTDENLVYWENDITSHTMAIPSKFTVFGDTPGQAMPAPYVNACGLCHASASLAGIDKFDSGSCGACHKQAYNEWLSSPHAQLTTSVTGSSSASRTGCFRCHIGQRFISEQLAGDGTYTGTLPYKDPIPQGCAVCHYPHFGNAIATPRLRMEGKVRLPEGPPSDPSAGTYIEAGNGRVCAECHNSRRSDPEADAVARWNTSSSAWRLGSTPHNGNQGETYFGLGAVTSFSTGGLNEPDISNGFHATPDFIRPKEKSFNACVTCHMYGEGKPHEWHADIEGCADCHQTDPDWDAWGGASPATDKKPARGDYDGNGVVEDIEAEYEGLLARILGAMTDGQGSGIGTPERGFGYTWLGGFPYWFLGTNMATPPDADATKVAWNFVLFEHDLSACFHNPDYAFQVLRASWTVLGRKLLGNNAWVPPGSEWEPAVR